MKTSDLIYWYKFFNRKYFGNRLPKHLWVHFGKLKRNRLGETRFRKLCSKCDKCIQLRKRFKKEIKNDFLPHDIRINQKFKSGLGCDEMSITTLLHEMVHISISAKYHHGPKFKKELRRLMTVGAFDRVLC
jgi:hypothetical protein